MTKQFVLKASMYAINIIIKPHIYTVTLFLIVLRIMHDDDVKSWFIIIVPGIA